ncbi:hypothetical protein [Actinoalloteichus caeruleus]|uniref:Uncharacterized protein n=1 Tax=Actinoalloteichus caeruleus DSM 43889 TaxID=1120930 RepID=A0ABT1JM86_ACTCY|nr:hypothetical protein [Actinoalloteichus caeruleus]MCP2332831.1 hypothetical protein [Actinoalloteichus caeruleus DSM 43889]
MTKPREPTLAEKRARMAAERRRREEEERAAAAAEARARTRKRVLIGGGVTVGVVALVAVMYAAAQPNEEVTAYCVDSEDNVVEDESYCDPQQATSNGGYVGTGGLIWIAGNSYHYNYGGTPNPGGTVSGGTTVRPNNAEIRTQSGTTIQRGGFGTGRGSGGS